MIGRLFSTLFSFVNGHIYYNNNLIKIRYDLLKKADSIRDFGENDIFNYYDEILPLGIESVQNGFPLAQNVSQRLIYIIKCQKF